MDLPAKPAGPATRVETAETVRSPGVATDPEQVGDGSAWAGRRIDRFTVTEQLGAGGMGVVLAAHDPRLDRKVALKLVRGNDLAAGGRARLLREGHAMARLSHPNVLTVYEAGTVDDDVFLVMELVEGRTLRAWLAERERSWREVVDVFVAIGRGLVAAHAAGLIHRDLKPDNVLVGRDDRPRVMDFGLVAAAGEVVAPGPRGGSMLEVELTQTGSIMGTPVYMAPEQHLGEEVDARADQWAYCASLFEALWRRLPFGGKTLDAIRDAVLHEAPAEPTGGRAPASVRRVVMKGLARDPAKRYASMAALLDDLIAVGVRRRRIAIAAAGLAVASIGGGAAWALTREETPDRCATAAAPAAVAWSPAVRDGVRGALAGVPRSEAGAIADRVVGMLDAKVAGWRAMRVEACRATFERGTQSPALLDRRMRCLDERLGRFTATVGVLSDKPDGELLDRAVELAGGTLAIDRCTNELAMGGDHPLPADPVAIDALRTRNDVVTALTAAGRLAKATEMMETLLPEARAAQYPPLLADVLGSRATLHDRAGDHRAAADAVREAIELAAIARNYHHEAELWIVLLGQLAQLEGPEKALAIADPASVAVARAGDPPDLRAWLLQNLAIAYQNTGDLASARGLMGTAVALQLVSLPPRNHHFVETMSQLGELLRMTGDLPRALAMQREALSIGEETLGKEAPRTVMALGRVASLERTLGNLAAGTALQEEAVRRAEAAYGPDSVQTRIQRTQLATAYAEDGKFDAARPLFAKTIAALEHEGGVRPLFSALHQQCSFWLRPADAAMAREAEPICRRALEVAEKAYGPKSPYVALERSMIAQGHLILGDGRAAEPEFRRGLALLVDNYGEGHAFVPVMLNGLGRALALQGRFREAIPIAERNQAIVEKAAPDPRWIADGRFVLAQLRWDSGDRALGFIEANRALAVTAEFNIADVRDRIVEWLVDHPAPARRR
jgi:tetratricopeptide (TPR) repeat protein